MIKTIGLMFFLVGIFFVGFSAYIKGAGLEAGILIIVIAAYPAILKMIRT